MTLRDKTFIVANRDQYHQNRDQFKIKKSVISIYLKIIFDKGFTLKIYTKKAK